MKPLFTIHAGEYLAGERIEKTFPECEIWVPVKDSGTDLLITSQKNRGYSAGIQVKYSKDFVPGSPVWQKEGFSAMSLFNLPPVKKIQQNNADAWVFALYAFSKKIIHCVIIEPAELMRRLEKLPVDPRFYLWVTADEQHCFATRGLKKTEEQQIAAGDFSTIEGTPRDFSSFLENWTPVKRRIKPSSAR